MMVVISLILAVIPLLGIVWIAVSSNPIWPPTVDALFTSLILLAISAPFALGAFLELRSRMRGSSSGGRPASSFKATATADGGVVQRGKVREVLFFESNVGQPNKSIVTLSDGGSRAQTLVLEGDMRNALPIGQKVEIVMRKQKGENVNVLVDVNYA
jgi:hypothetical protein